ncbi:MAG: hypothetical protein M3P48_09520 [Actinomycetota bacterium]|nr:hypothetical protein [Actinomycetota bacterium]
MRCRTAGHAGVRALVRAVLAVVVLGALLVMPGAAASAADTCARTVVDTARRLDAGQEARLRRTAQRLAAQGIRARVRALSQVPGGDLDAWMRAEQRRCRSWRGPAARDGIPGCSWSLSR